MPDEAPRLSAMLVLLADKASDAPPLRRRASSRPSAPTPLTPPPISGR